MKWTLLLVLYLFVASPIFTQNNLVDSLQRSDNLSISQKKETEETVEEKINKVLSYISEQTTSEEYYKLYPTANAWTFLKLDTRNGKIWKVQFYVNDVDNNKRFETSINLQDLTYDRNKKASRFELYPTQNNYNFLLLDKKTGRVWQTQWSMDPEKRWIERIY